MLLARPGVDPDRLIVLGSVAGGGETVLVADDNEMLRKLLATLLRQNGFQVLLAEDGREAVEVFRREQGRIALAILDGQRNGVVITGLHSRHDSRLYAKPIEGCASGYTLIPEEREAIERAIKGVPAESRSG